MWLSSFPNSIYWRVHHFFIDYSWLPCQMLIEHIYECLFGALYYVTWSMCLFLCQYHAVLVLYLCCSFKSKHGSPSFVFFFQVCFSHSGHFIGSIQVVGLFFLHTSRRVIFSISVRNDIGNLKISLNLHMALGGMDIWQY